MVRRVFSKNRQHPNAQALGEGIRDELARFQGIIFKVRDAVLSASTIEGDYYMEVVFWNDQITVTGHNGDKTPYDYDDPKTTQAVIDHIRAETLSWPQNFFVPPKRLSDGRTRHGLNRPPR